MNKYNDHIRAIKNNYPTSGYSALCEALDCAVDLMRKEMESAEKCECTSQELCEYCDPALVNPFIDEDGLYLFIDKDRLFAGYSDECTFEKSESVKINYCSACGRKLEVVG